jgi:hypothetical protein
MNTLMTCNISKELGIKSKLQRLKKSVDAPCFSSALADSLRPECGPSFHRDIDFGDWEALSLEHGPHLFDRHPDGCDERVCTFRVIVGGQFILLPQTRLRSPTQERGPHQVAQLLWRLGRRIGRRRTGRLRLHHCPQSLLLSVPRDAPEARAALMDDPDAPVPA